MRRRAVAGFAAIVGVIVLSPTGYASSVVRPSTDVVRAPDGCPAPEAPDVVAEPDRVVTIVPEETAPTATDHVTAGLDLDAALDEARALASRLSPVATFVLPSTGMDVTVLSDGPLEVDVEALDRLTRLPLTQPDLFRSPRVAEVQRCYADRILEGRELAGHELRIIVPADPGTCFAGGRVIGIDLTTGMEPCESAGVTLPALALEAGLFGLDIVHAEVPATVIVTAATLPGGGDPARSVAALLLHELHHVIENAFGLTPWSGSLRHYEQRAYYVEREVRRHLRRRGLSLPLPIRFPADTVTAADG